MADGDGTSSGVGIGMIIGLLVVVILLIGGGYYFFGGGRASAPTAPATVSGTVTVK